ncbi:MAG TPA: DedA family protein [Solirubrobacteraceae bacterium]|nr:DedA family protein [Solirubrobacteraceae bacterium]
MIELASIFTVATNIGYPLIFLIVVIETGCGVPVAPGELALLTGAIAASDGKLNIFAVIGVAAVAAIIGDNIGYVIGRKGGRWLLERPGLFARQRREVLGMADWFFDRHGPKAVFIGRWLPVLRVYASWLAGGSKMDWRKFAMWNAAGGIVWALSIGLFGYFVGSSAKSLMNELGPFAIIVVLIGIVGVAFTIRRQRHRFRGAQEGETEPAPNRDVVADSLITQAVEPPA